MSQDEERELAEKAKHIAAEELREDLRKRRSRRPDQETAWSGIVVKKPARPTTPKCPMEVYRFAFPPRAPAVPQKPQTAWRTPAARGTTAVLDDSNRKAVFPVTGGGIRGQSRITVQGCGPVPSKLKDKRKPILAVTTVGKNGRLAVRDVTCDGEAVLELAAVEVRVELLRPGHTITVVVEPRPEGSAKKAGPKRWATRRLERPVDGRYRKPKPRT